MGILKNIFTPLANVSKSNYLILVFLNIIVALSVWQITATGGLIPTPIKVFDSFLVILKSGAFIENMMISLTLTLKGMFFSILIALVISYLSLIPFFNPFAKFIIKCRYLTLTGLIFLFTLLTSNGHNLKMSLLIFGIVPFFVTSFLSIIDGINIQEYELCKTLRMNNWRMMYEVVIIGRLDQALEVIRQNFAIAWMMITMVEGLSMSEGGLGTMLIKSNKFIDLGTVFAILLLIFLIGVCCDFILKKLRSWLFPYTNLELRK